MTNGAKPKMAMLAPLNGDSFLHGLARALEPWIELDVVVTSLMDDVVAPLAHNQIIWIEWADNLAEILTRKCPNVLEGKRVIVRLHSFEAFDGRAELVDFNYVDDLIFVAPHIKQIVDDKFLYNPGRTRAHVIPNGVDLNRFQISGQPKGRRIAFLGNPNHKKDPMVMLHAFLALHKHDPECSLHIAGRLDQIRYELGMKRFVEVNGLQDKVKFYGFVKDVPGWLADKDYVLVSSVMEGHPVGALEAMCCGLQPLIYAWPGSENLFPPEFLWNSFDELIQRYESDCPPDRARRFVRDNYTLGRQAGLTRSMIMDQKVIEFTGYRWS